MKKYYFFIVITLLINTNLLSQTVPVTDFGLVLNERNRVINENDTLLVYDLNYDNLPELIQIKNDSIY
ncbi:MAG: hypothetical protein KAR38_05765, partial [Calditrichia bacterium]|nr:hypothetical protein [Calditrichia bacterium]